MNEFRGKDGKFNMCKGIMDLMENSKAEGREKGREEGREEGINIGVIEAHRSIIANMLEMQKSIEEICQIIGCDAAYVEKIMQDEN